MVYFDERGKRILSKGEQEEAKEAKALQVERNRLKALRDETVTILNEKTPIINEIATRLSAELGTLENKLPVLRDNINYILKELDTLMSKLEHLRRTVAILDVENLSREGIVSIYFIQPIVKMNIAGFVSSLNSLIRSITAQLKDRDPALKRIGDTIITETKRLSEALVNLETAVINYAKSGR